MAIQREKKAAAAGPPRLGGKSSSQLIDRQLARYRQMRDFEQTPEPSGSQAAPSGPAAQKKTGKKSRTEAALPFVIQKHAATRLHYDFRLGLHGVLKSWAVTKGPSYSPSDKRLAVQVEDHPMEYGGFEGTIPKGQYGGGTVMLWDEGTWEPIGNPDEGLAKGNLKFALHGKKLQGNWVLVRMGGRFSNEAKPNWLLIKEHDEFERPASDPPITEESPDSVLTGRDLEAIGRQNDHVWNSDRPADENAASHAGPSASHGPSGKKTSRKAKPFRPRGLKGSRQKLLGFITPQLAVQQDQAPEGDAWIHELKLDGYRIQARIESTGKSRQNASVHLLTRRGLDWTNRMPGLALEIGRLQVESAILDGEAVVLDDAGHSSFSRLQNALGERKADSLSYFAFDLLYLNGYNLTSRPLLERKRLLASLIGTLPSGSPVHISDFVRGDGPSVFAGACRLGAEGIVSKKVSCPYVSGRGSSWIKVKCILEQEFVIGGFTFPSTGVHGVGSLLLGYYEKDRLQYAGRTGTGFTQESSNMLRDRLDRLRQEKSPFFQVPAEGRQGAIWTKPELIAQVKFHSWTADQRVRQSSFQGLREDILPESVRREGSEASAPPKKERRQASRSRRSVANQSENPEPRSSAWKSRPISASRDNANSRSRASKPQAQGAGAAAIRVTHPNKIIDSESRLSKQALVDYCFAVAPQMLPFIAGRPIMLLRCPEGVGSDCFYQKHLAAGMPEGIEGVTIPNSDGKGTEEYVTVRSAEGIAGLAQMNVLEIHPWGSTNNDLEHPDRLIFDLDPDDAVSWTTLADAARQVRDQLSKLGLKSFLKLTGGKGLHIVAPLKPRRGWGEIKAFARAFTLQIEQSDSKLYISKMSKTARKNKIFIDYLRNERGATAIAPYSPRARQGVPAALPLSWAELKEPERPRFTVAAFAEWKARLRRDPWKGMAAVGQELPKELFERANE